MVMGMLAWERVDIGASVTKEARKIANIGMTRLTGREDDVLRLLVEAKTAKIIARELGISNRTVELYRARVLEKLGARNVIDLMRIVVAIN